jgi:hypothetical protein
MDRPSVRWRRSSPISFDATHAPSARNATLAWNILGIGDLVVAVGTGFLTSPSPYRLLAFDRPNVVVESYPFVRIPTFLVPLSIIMHGLSLAKLRRADRNAPAFA